MSPVPVDTIPNFTIKNKNGKMISGLLAIIETEPHFQFAVFLIKSDVNAGTAEWTNKPTKRPVPILSGEQVELAVSRL